MNVLPRTDEYSGLYFSVQVPSLILVPRNLVQLYSSVPRNIKKLRKIPYFPVLSGESGVERGEG
jgi:hypothetical protein